MCQSRLSKIQTRTRFSSHEYAFILNLTQFIVIFFHFNWKVSERLSNIISSKASKPLQSPGVSFYHNQLENSYHVDVSADSFTWRLKTTEIKPDSWFHLLFTWSKVDGINLYQDGLLVAESPVVRYSTEKVPDSFTHLIVGNSTGNRNPNIQMSDLRILYKFLTSTEVKIYANDKGKEILDFW